MFIQTTNNVDLIADVAPNPLGSKSGMHTMWFNNNNSWIASIASTSVVVRDAKTAELDLFVNGKPVRSFTVNIGNVGAWRSTRPITTTVAQVAGATSSGEVIDMTCSISRCRISPNLPPPRLFPLHLSALVSF